MLFASSVQVDVSSTRGSSSGRMGLQRPPSQSVLASKSGPPSGCICAPHPALTPNANAQTKTVPRREAEQRSKSRPFIMSIVARCAEVASHLALSAHERYCWQVLPSIRRLRTAFAIFALLVTPRLSLADEVPMNIGQKLWFGFGDGKGYQRQILALDATASVSITLIEGAAWAQNLTSPYSLAVPGSDGHCAAPHADGADRSCGTRSHRTGPRQPRWLGRRDVHRGCASVHLFALA